MAYLAEITDHAQRMLARVLSQFADSSNLRKLIELIGDEIQVLEVDVVDVYTERLLDTAVGVQLDQYGKVLNFARNGLSDSDYRAVLKVRILANRASGSIPIILDVASTVLGALLTIGVSYIALYPAGYAISYVIDDLRGELSPGLRIALVGLLLDMRPAGVSLEIQEAVDGLGSDEEPYFGVDEDPNSTGLDDASSTELGQGGGGFLNTQILAPITSTWPFPASGLRGVWALAHLESWSNPSNHVSDGDPLPNWPSVRDNPRDATSLTRVTASAAAYDRYSGTIQRGAVSHVIGTVRPYKTGDGRAFFPANGDFTFHMRVRLDSTGGASQTLAAQWDPTDANRCGLFFLAANGFYWFEGGSALVTTAIVDTRWHDITVTRAQDDDVSIYVDRVLIDTDVASATLLEATPMVGASSATGGSTTGPSFQFELGGDWSIVVSYHRELPPSELVQMWDAIDAIDGRLVVGETYPQAVRLFGDGLHFWRGDESSGPIFDTIQGAQANLNSGITPGGPSIVDGFAQQMDHDGTVTANITVSNAVFDTHYTTNSFTLIAWFTQDFTPAASLGLFYKQLSAANAGFQAFTNGSKLDWRVRDGSTEVSLIFTPSVGVITSGTWLLGFVVDREEDKSYILAGEHGGIAELSASGDISSVGSLSNTSVFGIGDASSAPEFEGQSAGAFVVGHALSLAEFQKLLDSGG